MLMFLGSRWLIRVQSVVGSPRLWRFVGHHSVGFLSIHGLDGGAGEVQEGLELEGGIGQGVREIT